MSDVLVRLDTGDDTCIWVRVDAVDAVGNKGKNDSMVVLRSGVQLAVKGKSPDEVMLSFAEEFGEVNVASRNQ